MNIKAQLARLWSNELAPETAPELSELNRAIEPLSPLQRVERALELLPGNHVLSSSFGAQSAVMLHLVNTAMPGIPVVPTDTCFLFPETYRFMDELTDKLKLNLKTYRSESSPAWQESRFGKLWDQGLDGIERYNRMNKTEPMNRALRELGANTWFSGLRRSQGKTR